ncbi:hypothetical protein L3Q82_017894 [Scortum barcoo]|uniref:Uncharacterized protein n=1 Tax=Scortum barcoo TaxID=214431 RepID=A0ACB8VIQ0_9TELE|nr:hypothetical protein L3Q82_017894 [Scortum barcoo]
MMISGCMSWTLRVKRGAELSTDYHLVVSWLCWQRRKLDRPGRPKRIVRVCWERVWPSPLSGRSSTPTSGRASHRFRGRLGRTLSPSGLCSLPPLSTRQFEVVGRACRGGNPEPGGGHRNLTGTGRPSKPQPGWSWRQKLRVWEEFGEAMEEDYRSASKRFWQTVRRLRRGKQYSANTVYSAGGEVLTSTEDIVGRWKKYFEDLLNPTDLPSSEEAEAGDSEVDSSITQAEVTEVVRKLLGGKGTLAGCWRVYGSLPNQSTCALWIWRRHSTVSLVVFCGECSSQDLQHVLLERFAAECEAAGMRISTSKSEAMVLDRKRVACPLRVGGEVLPQVEEFRYLGVLFTK